MERKAVAAHGRALRCRGATLHRLSQEACAQRVSTTSPFPSTGPGAPPVRVNVPQARHGRTGGVASLGVNTRSTEAEGYAPPSSPSAFGELKTPVEACCGRLYGHRWERRRAATPTPDGRTTSLAHRRSSRPQPPARPPTACPRMTSAPASLSSDTIHGHPSTSNTLCPRTPIRSANTGDAFRRHGPGRVGPTPLAMRRATSCRAAPTTTMAPRLPPASAYVAVRRRIQRRTTRPPSGLASPRR